MWTPTGERSRPERTSELLDTNRPSAEPAPDGGHNALALRRTVRDFHVERTFECNRAPRATGP